MNNLTKHIHNFFDDPSSLRDTVVKQDYQGIVSPIDNVLYPDISEVPASAQLEIKEKLEAYFKKPVSINYCFLRLSMEGTYAPHHVHNDISHGKYTLICYLDKAGKGGTSVVEYVEPSYTQEMWERDHKNLDKWNVVDFCQAEFNKAFLFDAMLMHRSEPINGYGDTVENGRLVIVTFFNVEEESI